MIKFLIFFFLMTSLSHCFLVPKIKIKRAFQKKDCQKLSVDWIYDLSIEELKMGVQICLEKKQYHSAISLLNQEESLKNSLLKKVKIFEERGKVYLFFIKDYTKAIREFRKSLAHRPDHFEINHLLIMALIKEKLFKEALGSTQKLLSQKITRRQRLELEFIRARLLLFLQRKEQALQAFQRIKQKDPRFFEKRQGAFYTALLLEEDKKFLEAIKELQQTNWPFLKEKVSHWERRDENKPGRGL